MKKGLLFGIIVVAVILAAVLLLSKGSGASNFEAINAIGGNIEIHKSLTCGCCDVYSKYVNSKVDVNVKIFDGEEPDAVKERYGVPKEMESCHTTIIGDYFVEGHIPLEAVEKLLKEQPDIAGIAMPGMPSGSPGMPGQKYGDFIIYAVKNDGSYGEFMRI
jgi:hypothetical protein